MQFYWILHFLNFYPPLCYVTWHSAKNFSKANCVCVKMEQLFASLDRLNIVLLNLLQVRNNKKVGSFLRWLENFHQIAEVFPTFLKKYIDCIRDYFRGERNSLAWEYYEGYFPFSQRLLANLILKSHKFHIFVIKHSVLGILHGNLSTHTRQLTPKITAFDKSK